MHENPFFIDILTLILGLNLRFRLSSKPSRSVAEVVVVLMYREASQVVNIEYFHFLHVVIDAKSCLFAPPKIVSMANLLATP